MQTTAVRDIIEGEEEGKRPRRQDACPPLHTVSREGRTIETEDNRTSVNRTIVQYNDNLAADVAAKKLLAHASILAYILKDCCTEFKSLQLSDIANYSIGANAEVGITPVHPNESEDASSSQMLDGNRKVLTESEESSEKNAPTLKFDILFTVNFPHLIN